MKEFKKCCLPGFRKFLNMYIFLGSIYMIIFLLAGALAINGNDLIRGMLYIFLGVIYVPIAFLFGQYLGGNNAQMYMTFIENGVQVRNDFNRKQFAMTWDEVVDCGVCYASMHPKVMCGLFFAKKEIPLERRKFPSVQKMQNTADLIFVEYSESTFNEMLPYLPEHIKEKLAASVEYCKENAIIAEKSC